MDKANREFLRKINIFKDLDDAGLDKISSLFSEEKFKKGEHIIHEGDHSDSMYILYKGMVGITVNIFLKMTKGGFEEKEKTLIKLSPSEFSVFGEMALLEHDIRTATVTALSECEMYKLTGDDFTKFAREYPAYGFSIAVNIAKMISSRLRRTNKDIAKLTTALSIALES
jgi:CRP/FNR family cyclic AMP-dependent transcriptional regulator